VKIKAEIGMMLPRSQGTPKMASTPPTARGKGLEQTLSHICLKGTKPSDTSVLNY